MPKYLSKVKRKEDQQGMEDRRDAKTLLMGRTDYYHIEEGWKRVSRGRVRE
jgi:hypothetical protein